MAKTVAVEEKPGIIDRVWGFGTDVVAELKKVSWPSLEDLKLSTKVTLYMLGIMAIVTFIFDKVFEIGIFTLLNLVS